MSLYFSSYLTLSQASATPQIPVTSQEYWDMSDLQNLKNIFINISKWMDGRFIYPHLYPKYFITFSAQSLVPWCSLWLILMPQYDSYNPKCLWNLRGDSQLYLCRGLADRWFFSLLLRINFALGVIQLLSTYRNNRQFNKKYFKLSGMPSVIFHHLPTSF